MNRHDDDNICPPDKCKEPAKLASWPTGSSVLHASEMARSEGGCRPSTALLGSPHPLDLRHTYSAFPSCQRSASIGALLHMDIVKWLSIFAGAYIHGTDASMVICDPMIYCFTSSHIATYSQMPQFRYLMNHGHKAVLVGIFIGGNVCEH